MSSAIQASYSQRVPHPVQPAPAGTASMHGASAPAGTFAPGTKVQVGTSRVVIERYLSEGGFAHVYLVRLPPSSSNGNSNSKSSAGGGGTDNKAVLKRVAVPDKEALANMRTEVETMKKLKGHAHIVTYFDSHASQLRGGGYEVFLLMEYCSGGGLIDLMNTRLQHRLTEPEVLKIFADTARGVACLHYLRPPLLHRDLKVENILISEGSNGAKEFKLCDFGSTAPPRPAATSAAEGRLIEEDVQKHTTMQYRSPEMVDVYRKQPIDEKSDIWALGVLLYKLCYYTTPFEEQGQMAILNASFRFPGYPSFSDRIKKLIAMMLQEKPQKRPNIYQVVEEVCAMRGTKCPIKDIYTGRTASESRRNQELPPTPGQIKAAPPVVGAYKAAPAEEQTNVIPDIAPMRRGRPTSNLAPGGHSSNKPSPSPGRPVSGDPFAALDSNPSSATVTEDELSSRFPSLDQFSLLHESGGTFSFEGQPAPLPKPQHQREQSNVGNDVTNKARNLSQRVTEALADEAFATSSSKTDTPNQSKSVAPQVGKMTTAGTQTSISPPSPAISAIKKSTMVSTGTMTSDASPPPRDSNSSHRPVFRFPPTDQRSSSQPRPPVSPNLGSDAQLPQRPTLQDHRSKSQIFSSSGKPSVSSRPSLEISRPPQNDVVNNNESSNHSRQRSRPVSTHLETAANFIKGRSSSRGKESIEQTTAFTSTDDSPSGHRNSSFSNNQISNNVDFLKAMEEDDASKRKDKRLSTGAGAAISVNIGSNSGAGTTTAGSGPAPAKHSKRSSLPSMSLSGTKNLLAGRFGEAFRRFEHNGPTQTSNDASFDSDADVFPDSGGLTPIAGSEATDGRSDDGLGLGLGMGRTGGGGTTVETEEEEMSPEMRRELERRRLSAEERRVTEAAAAYKMGHRHPGQRNYPGGGGGHDSSRAATIQNKVQQLLDESNKSPTKTAEGYGRFTASPAPVQDPQQQHQSKNNHASHHSPAIGGPPPSGSGSRTPATTAPLTSNMNAHATPNLAQRVASAPTNANATSVSSGTVTTAPVAVAAATATATSGTDRIRPNASVGGPPPPSTKPKPQALRAGGTGGPLLPAKPKGLAGNATTRTGPGGAGATGLRGAGGAGVGRGDVGVGTAAAAETEEDWEANFSRRYPSLDLEMVETEISASGGGGKGVRDI